MQSNLEKQPIDSAARKLTAGCESNGATLPKVFSAACDAPTSTSV